MHGERKIRNVAKKTRNNASFTVLGFATPEKYELEFTSKRRK